MDIKAVQASYARWAPVYDRTFGALTRTGRRQAVGYINSRSGSVLEVGVGTGLSLRHYRPGLAITGIDFSAEMLEKARAKVHELGLEHSVELLQMDACALDFPDNHFDTVAAMHFVSVVPEPEQAMAEMARVCKPGGKIVITNHFARDKGILSLPGRMAEPFADALGWHSDFRIDRILTDEDLTIERKEILPPLGMMTFLVLEKSATA